MNTSLWSAYFLTLSLFTVFSILHSSSTFSQVPIIAQEQNASTVEIQFPDEAQIKLVNGSSKTGKINGFDTDGVSLSTSSKIIASESIKEIVFLKRAHVRGRDRSPVLNGGKEDIAWRVSSNKIKLRNAEYGIVSVDLDGVLSPGRIQDIRNRLSDKDIICRVKKLVFKSDKTIVIEGTIETTVFS